MSSGEKQDKVKSAKQAEGNMEEVDLNSIARKDVE